MYSEPNVDEIAGWSSGERDRKMEAYKAYRQRTGVSNAAAVLDLYASGEDFAELEPMALLRRIKALEARGCQ